jgi:hypothetical protein
MICRRRRQIVTDLAPLRRGLTPDQAAALDRAIATFARLDIEPMRRSGAFFAASRLGLGLGLVSRLDAARDPLRYARRLLQRGRR